MNIWSEIGMCIYGEDSLEEQGQITLALSAQKERLSKPDPERDRIFRNMSYIYGLDDAYVESNPNLFMKIADIIMMHPEVREKVEDKLKEGNK